MCTEVREHDSTDEACESRGTEACSLHEPQSNVVTVMITQRPAMAEESLRKHRQRETEIIRTMNEPLKQKLFSVYGSLLSYRRLEEAWKCVKANHGAGGVDKVSIEAFDKNHEAYLNEILNELKTKITRKGSKQLRKLGYLLVKNLRKIKPTKDTAVYDYYRSRICQRQWRIPKASVWNERYIYTRKIQLMLCHQTIRNCVDAFACK